jgi:hypothetical protein
MPLDPRLIRKAVLLSVFGLALVTGGCTSYYSVSDPKTGKQYYTTEWHTGRGGTTRFVDARTGALVTIQESEIREINEKDFQSNTGKN